jgi:hypothetical protein
VGQALSDADTCPVPAFGQASTVTMISSDSDSAGSVAALYRQTDGNCTAQGFPIAKGVATKIGSLTHAQDLFVSCRGIAPWTPCAAGLGDRAEQPVQHRRRGQFDIRQRQHPHGDAGDHVQSRVCVDRVIYTAAREAAGPTRAGRRWGL